MQNIFNLSSRIGQMWSNAVLFHWLDSIHGPSCMVFFLVSKYQYSKSVSGQIGLDFFHTQCDQDFNTESNLINIFKETMKTVTFHLTDLTQASQRTHRLPKTEWNTRVSTKTKALEKGHKSEKLEHVDWLFCTKWIISGIHIAWFKVDCAN